MKRVYLILSFAASVILCTAVNSHAADLAAGQIAYYPFNGNAIDESGNGYDGAVIGATLTANRFGDPDSAYYFDGVNDRIDLPSSVLDFERNNSYSKSFWIKTADSDLKNNIIAKMTATLDARGINVVLANGLLRVQLVNHNTGGNRIRVDGTTVLSDNQWHHIVVTYDGSSTAAGVRLYVDGNPEGMTVVHDTLTGTILNSKTPTIGSRNSEYGFYYTGIIDDVRIHNRALSDAEVAELYSGGSAELVVYSDILTNTLVVAGESATKTITVSNAGNSDLEFSFCSPSADEDDGLILHYTFDDDVGTTAVDQSGNGNDGIIMNSHAYVEGVHGQGLKIIGNSSSVSSSGGHVLLSQIDFNGMDEVTVSLWVNEITMHHPHGERYINFGEVGSSTNPGEISISKHISGDIMYRCGESVLLDNFAPAINQFVHYALTFSSGYMKTYRNGILLDTTPAELNVPYQQYAALGRHWWSDGTQTSTRLTAVFDDVRIYSRALSDDEITDLYSTGDDGLVAYYSFDGNANDASGNGADGIIEGALPTFDHYGNENKALWFDEGRYVRTTASSGPVDIVGKISFASWVYPTQLTVKEGGVGIARTIARKRSWHNSYGYNFSIQESGLLAAAFGNSSTPYVATIAKDMDPIPVNCWSHVAMTFDGAEVCFYVNGKRVDTQPCTSPLLSTTEQLCIGRMSDTEDRSCFYGAIDELYLFNRALSSDEVSMLYAESDQCTLPAWLVVEPVTGTIGPGESMDVTVTFNASNRVAGDYVEHVLQLFSNDPEYPVVEDNVSMWVVPSAPELYPEPLCTVGRGNEVAWAWQDGLVEYWVEAVAEMHYAPSSRPDNRPLPTGWDQKKLAGWSCQAGWMSSTSYLFTDLRLNTIYLYRVKASVVTEIGRLEGEWSNWMPSCQVPVLPRAFR